ncbi:hypothetical protein [Flagellimonas sp.]|uniref:hypothetical protein n=1 Tax=Flagellimonas sp. TaxID=2058762 RepID=UPI003C797881
MNYLKIKHLYILGVLLVLSFNAKAQSDNEVAISYFIKAEKAYSNFKNNDAIINLDKVVEYLGNTNPKVEALYVKAYKGKKDYKNAKDHLSRYFEIADNTQSSYQEMLEQIAEIDGILAAKKAKVAKWAAEKQKLTDATFAIMIKEKQRLKAKVDSANTKAENKKKYIAEKFIKDRPESKMLIDRDEVLERLNAIISELNFQSDTLDGKSIMGEKIRDYSSVKYEVNENELFIYNYHYIFYPNNNRGVDQRWYVDYVDLNALERIEKGEKLIRLLMIGETYVPSLNYQTSNRKYQVPKDFRYTLTGMDYLRMTEDNDKNKELLALLDHLIYLNKVAFAKEYNAKNGALTASEIEQKQKFRPFKTYLERVNKEKPSQPLKLSWDKTVKRIEQFIAKNQLQPTLKNTSYHIQFKDENIITTSKRDKFKPQTKSFNLNDVDSFTLDYEMAFNAPDAFELDLGDHWPPRELLVNGGTKDGIYIRGGNILACCGIRLAFKNPGTTKQNYKSDPNYQEIKKLLQHLVYLNRQNRVNKIKVLFPNRLP